jgi:hypothetical protein
LQRDCKHGVSSIKEAPQQFRNFDTRHRRVDIGWHHSAVVFTSTSQLTQLDNNSKLLHSAGQVAVVRRHGLRHRLLSLFANVIICRFGVSEVGSDVAVKSGNKIQRHYFVIKYTPPLSLFSQIPQPDPPVTA